MSEAAFGCKWHIMALTEFLMRDFIDIAGFLACPAPISQFFLIMDFAGMMVHWAY
jgi:hypothetical protein